MLFSSSEGIPSPLSRTVVSTIAPARCVDISISGPPDVAFATSLGLNPVLRLVMWLLSRRTVARARRRGIRYSFLFMRADGPQLAALARLIDAGVIRPVVDRVFPFAQTQAALDYVETGRARGKVVIALPDPDHPR